MLGSFQRSERRGDSGISIRTRRRDDPCRERRVIAASVLHMQYEREVENFGFQLRKFSVGSQHTQKVLRSAEFGIRMVYVKAVVKDIMVVRLVAVNAQHRENAYQHQTLPYNVVYADIVSLFVVRPQRKHAPRQAHHHVLAGSLEYDVLCEIFRKFAELSQRIRKFFQLFFIGQIAHKQKIRNLLETISVALYQTVYQLVYAVPAVIELALARHVNAVDFL